MIKELVASNASKLVAACVCPVAGTIGLTVGVPQVREAVHRATAPRAYALPKTRTRQRPAGIVDEAPGVQTAALAAPPCAPALASSTLGNFVPTGLDNLQPFEPGRNPQVAGGPGPNGGGGGGGGLLIPFQPGAVPEPQTWVQLLVGFGVIGGAARYALRHNRVDLANRSET